MNNHSNFMLDYPRKQLPVTYRSTGKENEGDYTIEFDDRTYTVHLKEDNEGA